MSDIPSARSPSSLLSAVALPCGHEVDLLLEQVADGRGSELDTHQRGCVHCRAALTEFAALWRPVSDLAAAPVSIPAGLSAAVSSQVRALAREIWYSLETTSLGTIRIAARVVAALARDSARLVPGVRVAFGRSSYSPSAGLAERATLGHRHPHAAVGVLGGTAVVDLAVAVTYGDPLDEVARDVQRHVVATLRNSLGLSSVTVNIVVDDVITDEDH